MLSEWRGLRGLDVRLVPAGPLTDHHLKIPTMRLPLVNLIRIDGDHQNRLIFGELLWKSLICDRKPLIFIKNACVEHGWAEASPRHLESVILSRILFRHASISGLQNKSFIKKTQISNLQRSGGPHSSFPLRIRLRKALISDVQSSRGSTARFRTSRALEAPELISMKSSIKKRIDFGPPELWRLQSSFPLRILLRNVLISDVQSSSERLNCSIPDDQNSGASRTHFY